MTLIFDQAFKNLLCWEGGYGDNLKDPGGPTNLGVTQVEYDFYRHGKGLLTQSVRHITIAEAEEIYRNEYWQPTRCSDLNPGVGDALFDADVNSGDRRGVKWLQQAINRISGKAPIAVDGVCGDITIMYANAIIPSVLISTMLILRLAFMKVARNSKTGALLWDEFGHGWQVRIDGVRKQACAMALIKEGE
jgi:lysozyme family protein